MQYDADNTDDRGDNGGNEFGTSLFFLTLGLPYVCVRCSGVLADWTGSFSMTLGARNSVDLAGGHRVWIAQG